jgi:hypothetical protein
MRQKEKLTFNLKPSYLVPERKVHFSLSQRGRGVFVQALLGSVFKIHDD